MLTSTSNRLDSNPSHRVSRCLQLGLAVLALAGNFAFAATPIRECGTVISTSGSYFLQNDLACPSGTDGVDIKANNVTLTLVGHQISTSGFAGSGISVGVGVASGNSHVKIFGPGTITGFNAGVDFEQVADSTVENVTSTANFFGFVVNGGFTAGCGSACPSTGNTFQGNTSTSNNQHGFTLNSANNNTFSYNTASGNVNGNGILLFTASGNTVSGNVTNSNGGSGISISGGTGTDNTVSDNAANGNVSFDLFDGNGDCDNNTWINNQFGTHSQDCIN